MQIRLTFVKTSTTCEIRIDLELERLIRPEREHVKHHVNQDLARNPLIDVEDGYRECFRALGSGDDEATLVLDDHGNIVFCSPQCTALLASVPRAIVGRPIWNFIPELPLSASGAGSNVARASYWGRKNRWQQFELVTADQGSVPVDLRLDVLVVGYRYLILAWMRPVAELQCAARPKLQPYGNSPVRFAETRKFPMQEKAPLPESPQGAGASQRVQQPSAPL